MYVCVCVCVCKQWMRKKKLGCRQAEQYKN